ASIILAGCVVRVTLTLCAHLKSEVNAVLMAIRLAFFVIKLENVHEYKLFLFYSFGKIARKEWLLALRSPEK
ncbi:hypothetical protein V6D52_14300, partial [Idiomarina loihiensis]|uniref:hypothetical protein n=1 Tax=Idiomarina loihiensis TaxID=135577 RepID=UPI0039BE4691